MKRKRNLKGLNNPFFGKTHTIEQRKKWSKMRKGQSPWNKGLKTGYAPWKGKKRFDISMLFKGKKRSQETRKRISIIRQGVSEEEWKGFKSSQDYLERRRFQKTIQKEVFKRDDYTCQFCGIRGVALQVDHIQSWAEYVELRFNMDNCRTLCAKCHYKITFGKPMPPTVKAWGHNLERRIQL